MAEDNTKQQTGHGEIDLIELIAALWREKLVIAGITVTTALVGTVYAFTTPPTYQVSTELSPPSVTELKHLNQTELFSITPKDAFAEFINIVESGKHVNKLIKEYPELINKATNEKIDDDIFNKLTQKRNIIYPDINRKQNSPAPEKYIFSFSGIDKSTLNQLVKNDLTLASISTINKIEEQYKNNLHLKISKMEREQTVQQQVINDKLRARKTYVLASRSDRLKRLEEAFKIAKSLNLKSPASLSKLSEGTGNRQVEINAELNNRPNPLYLRGTKLLNAEIQNLKELDNNVFLDTEILNLENQKLLLSNNRELEQLKVLVSSNKLQLEVNFFNRTLNSPSDPVKPNKILILTISILLGGMTGLFIAIGRIIYKNIRN